MKSWAWTIWTLITLSVLGFYAWKIWLDEDKSQLLIGAATHGHFQIELACGACHTDAFGGADVIQEACVSCHGAELDMANDSHPQKKFTDPRNADLLGIVDARYCVSCHTEHQRENTHAMGVTLPDDYCFHCHQETVQERPSHHDLAFDSCASAGCHNYHDNRALYERFLIDNAGGNWLLEHGALAKVSATDVMAQTMMAKLSSLPKPLKDLSEHYVGSAHSQNNIHLQAGIPCTTCHGAEDADAPGWMTQPGYTSCQQCHDLEVEGYLQGRHGMRLAQNLPAMSPKSSTLKFKTESADLEQGCSSCHSGHEFDTAKAAVQACLGCHDDEHSQAFIASPHGMLNQQVQSGALDEAQNVTCATCHMPRVEHPFEGAKLIRVDHNQNHNLRPNEKMIRPVCMSCHSLEFSIDALADPALIRRNFTGKPSAHIPSIDWALQRDEK